MDSTQFYQQLLGIKSPWIVDNVNMRLQESVIDVHLSHPPLEQFPCPHCERLCSVYDHSPQRSWRHLDSCQCLTYIHACVPRIECPEHKVCQVKVPWAETKNRFTMLFEDFAITVLLATTRSRAQDILRLSWDEVNAIQNRAVKRGLKAKQNLQPKLIGVDEKAIAKGHKYMTLVYDLDCGVVEHVAHDRKERSLGSYYEQINPERINQIEAVAMDMWPAFIKASKKALPQASKKIVFDRFHLMGYVMTAVDKIRRQENKMLLKEGRKDLVGSKYLWLTNPENMKEKAKARFEGIRDLELKTSQAWAMKESLRGLWSCASLREGLAYWRSWRYWVSGSGLEAMIQAMKTLGRHLRGMMNYFRVRISNGKSESINAKIATIQKKACGFRNPENFKTAIYFYCGGLSLSPLTHRKV